MALKFYRCPECKTILTVLEDSSCVPFCGGNLEELIPNTQDGAREKHVPNVSVDGSAVKVTIGSVEHPMLEAHHIAWVVLETTAGFQTEYLKVGEAPVANFVLPEGKKAVAAYEYCNLHGLWKAEL